MNIKKAILIFILVIPPLISMAKENFKSSALYSPSCNMSKLKELAGDALIKISKQQSWANDTKGYILTLDLNEMTYSELTQKMVKENCFSSE